MYVCILSLLISLLINIVLSTPPNTPWAPPNPQLVPTPPYTGINSKQMHSILWKGGPYGVPWKCANVPLTTHMSSHRATLEKFQQRKPPEEEQKQESYEIHAKHLPLKLYSVLKYCASQKVVS